MNGYKNYMDRQKMSEFGTEKLLKLQKSDRVGRGRGSWAMAAACTALLVGLGVYAAGQMTLTGGKPVAVGVAPTAGPSAVQTPGLELVESAPPYEDADVGFVARVGAGADKLLFPVVETLTYADVSEEAEVSASIALPEGSFDRALTREEILTIFWGAEGKPAYDNPKADPGDFPQLLHQWDGYTIQGQATYDGAGELWELCVFGEKGDSSFILRAAPGRVPPTCVWSPPSAATDFDGTEVSAWYNSYDCDGDDEVERVVASQFMAGDVGVRFTNVNSGGMTCEDNSGLDQDLQGAILFNEMLVNQALKGRGVYLAHLAHTDDIVPWRVETFSALEEALAVAEFAPYLPQTAPEGFGEFYGRLDYQQHSHNTLWVRWSKGYDDVEVSVSRLEENVARPVTVDVDVPESYDWRLYDGPIMDVVPEEYGAGFYTPTFRLEDMFQDIVAARGSEKDTGGLSYHFSVLCPDGTVVSYYCSGVSEDYVWGLVKELRDTFVWMGNQPDFP